jgi:hypothetical protein
VIQNQAGCKGKTMQGCPIMMLKLIHLFPPSHGHSISLGQQQEKH